MLFCFKLFEATISIRGRIVKEQQNDIVKAIIIINPKSIIGFMSVIAKDPNATIVVKVV